MQNRSLYFGDNLEILSEKFPGNDGYFDLIYLDPPFNSNRNYNVIFKEGIVDSEAQIHAFEDSWHWTPETQMHYDHLIQSGDVAIGDLMQSFARVLGRENDMMAYLTMMTVRLVELHRVLKPTGSLYLHCDPTASHYLKIVLDTIFGKKNLKNEIIWSYKRWPAKQKALQRMHDVIFFYVKGSDEDYIFNILYQPLAASTLQAFGGKKQVADFSSGHRKPSILSEESKGAPMSDVWEIGIIAPISKERLGYPTQKPEALLERILKTSTNEDSWVLDPFCGCGTTVAVAERLRRNWVGIDISMLAIKLIESRLTKQYPALLDKISTNGLPKDMAAAKALFHEDPWDFEYWVVVHLLEARPPAGKSQGNMKGADKGIDGIITLMIDKENGRNQYGNVIVQVKGGGVQRNQIATLKSDVEREGATAGLFVTLESATAPMKEEAAMGGSVKTQFGEFPKIQIVTVEDLLTGNQPKLPGAVASYKQAEIDSGSAAQAGFDI